MLRSPVCVVVGHVDHGKSSLLDYIRSSNICAGEAGAITQSIGASIIPAETITRKCGDLLKKFNLKLNIPGLLFIDTPGHEAFSNLRKRGGSLADIAIVVVDMNEGFKPQTKEAVEILKACKTPFLVCANKVDLIPGYRTDKNKSVLDDINYQHNDTIAVIEQKMYEIVGNLSELGFESERFDRISDFSKQVAIIPASAKTGQGVPEVLMVLSALSQKYLEKNLVCNVDSIGRGTILEVKEEKGLGKTLDVILYDGCLASGDTLIVGTTTEPIVTKVRALLQPEPNTEMRDKKGKFRNVKDVVAATGIKISAPNLDSAIGGMPVVSCKKADMVNKLKEEIMAEIDSVMIESDTSGIVVKSESLGSLEALVGLLRQRNINVMRASIGDITRKDIMDAQSNTEDPLNAIIVGFNVKLNTDAEGIVSGSGVGVITSNIIYEIIDKITLFREQKQKELDLAKLSDVVLPAKFQIMPGLVFRQSHPVVCGIDMLGGILRAGTMIMKNGSVITSARAMELDKKSVKEAKKGEQVALSMDGVTMGRQVEEGDILYSSINEEEFKRLKEIRDLLTKDQIEVLKEIAEIMRKDNPGWGV